MPTCRLCNDYFPNRVLIDGKYRPLNKRKFCLKCSPFGRHNTRNLLLNPLEQLAAGLKKCTACGETKSELEYNYHDKKRGDSRFAICRVCYNKRKSGVVRRFKALAVKYKGGACKSCGYTRYAGSLDFHHRNTTDKDFNVAEFRGTRFNESGELSDQALRELDKCDLLCANCHREEHGRLASIA